MELTSLEILKELEKAVQRAIRIVEAQNSLATMTEQEISYYKRKFGDFDLIVGNFGIKHIRYEKTT